MRNLGLTRSKKENPLYKKRQEVRIDSSNNLSLDINTTSNESQINDRDVNTTSNKR